MGGKEPLGVKVKAIGFQLPAAGWFRRDAFGFISRNCMAMISGLRPLSPLWCLRHHLSPAKAGALWILSNVPHSSEGNRRANLPLRGRRRRRRQKGCISIARRTVCLFSTGEARLYGFAAGRRHTKWRRKAPTSPAERYYITPEGGARRTSPEGEADPGQNLWRPGA